MTSEERRGPSYLKRIETRARTLRDDPNFTNHLKRRRQWWNGTYPGCAVAGKGIVPEHVGAVGSLPVPSALYAVFGRADPKEVKQARGFVSDWAGMCLIVSNMFWPADDFPHSLGGLKHPAMPFVALCLIYDPQHVEAENIWSHLVHPWRFGHDPTRPETDPLMAMRHAQLMSLSATLQEAEAVGRGLSHSEIEDARHRSNGAGWRAYQEAMSAFDPDDLSAGYYYLPILPGMRSQDVRDAEQSILECSARLSGGEDFTRRRIRECLSAGQSYEAIAARLGVSRGTVSNVAKSR